MSTERTREQVREVPVVLSKTDSAITVSTSSYADDSCILISDTSFQADVFDTTDDASVNKSAITKSVSNDDDANVFSFPEKTKVEVDLEYSVKKEYNVCGKRFECGTGVRGIRKNLVEIMPVSHD